MERLFIVILCLLSLPGFSQNTIEKAESEYLMVTQYGKAGKVGEIRGTPFVFDKLVKADVLMDQGKVYQGVLINIYPQKAQVFIGDDADNPMKGKTVVLDTYKIQQVILEGSERVFKPVKVEGRKQIVEILYEDEGEIFLALHEKRFQKRQEERSYSNTKDQMDSYRPVIRYFWLKDKQEKEIKKGKTGLKTLSNDWKSLNKIAKAEKLDFNKPADMKKVFEKAKGGQ
jgi:hypothetical protein